MPTFRAQHPATGETLPDEFSVADGRAVEAAVRAAADAFAPYRCCSGAERAAFLHAVAMQLEARAAELVDRAHRETALPVARLAGELGRTCFQLRSYGDVAREGSWVDVRIDRGDPLRQPVPKPELRSMLRPVGPVVVFGASNFPFAYSTAGGDTASALAAGCPVIVKAHPAHPGTSERVGQCVRAAVAAAGLPAGVFGQLFDSGYDVGRALVQHPAIEAVGFTGSQRGGRALMDLAAARPRPIPVFAEMGSVNPVVVLPEAAAARGEQIAQGLHASYTLGVGQFCTNPGLVFLPVAAEAMRERLRMLTERTAAGTMLTAGIADAFARGIAELERQPDVTVLARGQQGAPGSARATVLTVAASTFANNPVLRSECFGPSTLLITYATPEELLRALTTIDGQLTASLHADRQDRLAEQVQSVLEQRAGRIVFGGFPTGVEVCDAQVHGGPYPATSAAQTTSVGSRALARFARLIAYQNAPANALPPELRDDNPLGLLRRVDGRPTRDPMS